MWLPLALKMAMTVALIAPLGFVMGMPFPTALQRLEEWHAPSVRWAWSLNAAASVLGSVGALVCAIYLGLVQTLIIGGLFYLAALAVVARTRGGTRPRRSRGRGGWWSAGRAARGGPAIEPPVPWTLNLVTSRFPRISQSFLPQCS